MAALVVWRKRKHHRNTRNKEDISSSQSGGRNMTINPNFESQQAPPPWSQDAAVLTRTTTTGERRPRPQLTVFDRDLSSLGLYRNGSDGTDDYDTYDASAAETQRPRSSTVYATTVPVASGFQASSHIDKIGRHSRTTVHLDDKNYVSNRRTLKLDSNNYVSESVCRRSIEKDTFGHIIKLVFQLA